MRSVEVSVAWGVVLGLLTGDAVGRLRGVVPDNGVLQADSGGQLACFTLEGLIRAHVRGMHKGICDPSSVVWYAYRRRAAIRGELPEVDREDDWGRFSGWLRDVRH